MKVSSAMINAALNAYAAKSFAGGPNTAAQPMIATATAQLTPKMTNGR